MDNNEKLQNDTTTKDEIDELLDEFLEKLCNELNNDETSQNDDENEDTPDNDKDESTDDEDDDWNFSCSDDSEDFETPDIPDGEIYQNHSLSVKAEIIPPLKNPREELDKLIGCKDIKKRLDELVALTKYNERVGDFLGKRFEVSLHSIFYGRPGTGKTTVCKIFGSLLHEAGALSKGHVVICTRGTFIGALYGDEERAVRQVVEKAKGGVLMIDEAYLLNLNNEKDPGHLVLPMLMDMLSDEKQRDIAVVLCGYKDPMLRLLEQNPGLESRFPNRFEFTDFSYDELLKISRHRVCNYGHFFTRQGWAKYKQVLAEAYQNRDPATWGNARFIANQLERVFIQHAVRCGKLKTEDIGRLFAITPSDIVPIEVPRQKPHIGF